MRLKKPFLLLLLLALAAAAAAAELNARKALRTGSQALLGRNSDREKLCGRDLIRAVTFTCGASRWKRLSETRGAKEPSLGGGASLEFVQSNSDRGTADIKRQSASDPEQEQLQRTGQPTRQQPLKHLFNFYGDYTSDNLSEYIGQTENAVQQSKGDPGMAKLRRSYNFPQVNSPHRKRDFSAEVSERCCKVGCTVNDLSRLC